MRSLDTGESPILTVRIPPHLRAALKAAAGPGRGARSRWLRAILEKELASLVVETGQPNGATQHPRKAIRP